jgi:hypothetical protein
MSIECKFCAKQLATKSSLKHHQQTAKYCLTKQNIAISDKYKCVDCNKCFSRKHHLETHLNSCNNYLVKSAKKRIREEVKTEINGLGNSINDKDQQIIELKSQIKILQDKLENVAIKAVSRPTTTNQNTINNYIEKLEVVTDKHFQEQTSNLTIEHIQKGPEGYAEYALEFPLKDRLVCVDYARRKIKYKDENGHVTPDPEMTKLATKFFESIKDKNKELIMKYGLELKERFGDEMELVVKLLDHKTAVDRGSEGDKSDFYHEFVKSVCNLTVV